METTQCPLCGAPKNWRELIKHHAKHEPAWRPWEERRHSPFALGSVADLPAGSEYERRRPIRDPHIESDVVTPGLQALISGLVGGILGGAIAAAAGGGRPWAVGLASGAGILGLSWFALLKENRALLWEVERIIGADIDGDGVAGPVSVNHEPEPRVTRVEVTEKANGRTRMRYVDVPLTDQELTKLAQAVLVRREPFSRRGLADVLSQSKYASVYQAMLDGGLIHDVGNGNELSGPGRAFLRQYLDA